MTVRAPHSRLYLNALATLAQTLVSAAVLFVLYRFLIARLGAETVGIWSVVLATTSASRLADLGLSGSVVRFVAKYSSKGDLHGVIDVVQTAAISIGALLAVVLACVYPLIPPVIHFVLPPGAWPRAELLVPFSLGSLWLASVASVFQSGLDGSQRFDIRNAVTMATNIVYMALVFLLVPRYGLLGLAYAQVVQAAVLVSANQIALRTQLSSLPLLPVRWSRSKFNELISYGVKFQIASLANILFDFTTKGLLSRFGSLANVAYYDMAARMVGQVRAIIVSATQVIIPQLVSASETGSTHFTSLYKRTYDVVTFVALIAFGSLIALAPFISLIWLGRYNPIFTLYTCLLSIAWFVNVANVPAFFANLANGALRWNIVGQVTIGAINLVLGVALGYAYGSTGVVVAWSIALVTGSVIVTAAYHIHTHVPFHSLLPRMHTALAGCLLVAIVLSGAAIIWQHSHQGPESVYLVLPVAAILLMIGPLSAHPVLHDLALGFKRSLLFRW
jgi:O-antigen/teichoic acid export membrane protein